MPLDARPAWRRLEEVSQRLRLELAVRLDNQERLTLSQFEVLNTLDAGSGGALRMIDLARAITLSPGGVTRVIRRLQNRNLVRRTSDPDDARAVRVELTEAGTVSLRRARAIHDRVIFQQISSRITAAELQTLDRVLDRLAKDNLRLLPISARHANQHPRHRPVRRDV